MDQGALDLRESSGVSAITADDVEIKDRVKLFSEYYGQEFTVEVTHRHGEELGGDIVRTSIDDPMLGKNDIIHFKADHIQHLLSTADVA